MIGRGASQAYFTWDARSRGSHLHRAYANSIVQHLYTHYTGKALEGAHRAMADVRATAAVLEGLLTSAGVWTGRGAVGLEGAVMGGEIGLCRRTCFNACLHTCPYGTAISSSRFTPRFWSHGAPAPHRQRSVGGHRV